MTTSHTPQVMKVHPDGALVGPAVAYYAVCSCGWADEIDRPTESAALDIHANHAEA